MHALARAPRGSRRVTHLDDITDGVAILQLDERVFVDLGDADLGPQPDLGPEEDMFAPDPDLGVEEDMFVPAEDMFVPEPDLGVEEDMFVPEPDLGTPDLGVDAG